MFRRIGIFGPSYVGKSTFVRSLIVHGGYVRAPLATTRPPRAGECEPNVTFVNDGTMATFHADCRFIVQRIGPYEYAVDLRALEAAAQGSNIVIDLAPTTVSSFIAVVPDLLTVLLWPLDFDVMQRALRRDPARPPHERRLRFRATKRCAWIRREAMSLCSCVESRKLRPVRRRSMRCAWRWRTA